MTPLDYAATIAYSNRDTLQFSYNCAKSLANVPGDFVECGVAAGAQIIAMKYGAPNKTIWAFDSFEGIPLPSNRDYERPGICYIDELERKILPNPGEQVLKSSGVTIVPLDSFYEHLNLSGVGIENVIPVKGWFEKTLPNNEVKEISLLRLDGDLYNSTYVCLKHLFEKVVVGGIVIIDDWMLRGSREACIDYFNKIRYMPNYQFVSNIAYFIR